MRTPRTEVPGAGAPATSGRALLLAGALALATILWMLAWLGDTAVAMVAIWSKSDTFAHGFLIFPISAWLIWRRRHTLAGIELRPGLLALPLLALIGFGWLFAGLASVGVVQQYCLVLMIPLIVWAVLGIQVTKALAFPLLFLLFAVPAGQFLEGMLMEHTADVTVAALRLTGIPVYREGQNFTIPTGNWSVVEACSGLRYVIASLTVGVLYAYLTYRSFARRAAFVVASLLVPIVANWLRAYMIVMIGHLSGMKYAVGVDHLIYGWVFFGVVMMLLFFLGSRWREDLDGAGAPIQPATSSSPRRPALAAIAGAAVATAVVVAACPVAAGRLEDATGERQRPVLQAPLPHGDWAAVPGRVADWTPRFLEAPARISQAYARETVRVGMEIRYYRNQRRGSQLIDSRNTLAVYDNVGWQKIGESRRMIKVGGVDVPVIEARLRSGSRNLVVWQWYWVDGRHSVNPYWAKFLQATSVLTGRGDDAAVVFLYVPYDREEEAAQRPLREFAGAMLPAISTSLENARRSGPTS